MLDNIINLEEKDLDLNIYRIYPLARFLEILNSKQNALVKTSLWEDPFENFILNSTGILSTGQTFSIASRNQYFGQCWSYKRESDAMWRIYSQHIKDPVTQTLLIDNIGIKVKSTARSVFEPLYSAQINAVSPFSGNSYNVFAHLLAKFNIIKKKIW